MSKLFTCDSCGQTSPHPFDEEKYRDEHGVWHTFDLCAPCRAKLKKQKESADNKFFKKLIK